MSDEPSMNSSLCGAAKKLQYKDGLSVDRIIKVIWSWSDFM